MEGDDERTDAEQEERDQDTREEEQRDDDGREEDEKQEDDGDDDDGSRQRAAKPSLSAKEMTRAAMEALQDLTGHTPEAASGLMWDGESWLVTVDVLELSRIPNTTDLLATYVVQLDGDGNLSGYKRTKRFQRSQTEEG